MKHIVLHPINPNVNQIISQLSYLGDLTAQYKYIYMGYNDVVDYSCVFFVGIYIYMGVVQNYGTPKTALTPRFREPCAPFRAPAESGHKIMIGFSFIYRFINSGIQTCREPYAALSRPFNTAAKHTHPYLQMSLGY